MNTRQKTLVPKNLPSKKSLPRDNIAYSLLERRPAGWVRVFHHLSIGKKVTLELCYTPDRYILQQASTKDWLACYTDWSSSWEALAIQLIDDFRNEIIPCWVRLTLQQGKTFRIEVEDRQPNWTPQRGIVSSNY